MTRDLDISATNLPQAVLEATSFGEPISDEVLGREAARFNDLLCKRNSEVKGNCSDTLLKYLFGVHSGLLDARRSIGPSHKDKLNCSLAEITCRLKHVVAGVPMPDRDGIIDPSFYIGRMKATLFALNREVAISATEVPSIVECLR